jgi:hypothetical protein
MSFQDIVDSQTDIRPDQAVNFPVGDRRFYPRGLGFVSVKIMPVRLADQGNDVHDRHGKTLIPRR